MYTYPSSWPPSPNCRSYHSSAPQPSHEAGQCWRWQLKLLELGIMRTWRGNLCLQQFWRTDRPSLFVCFSLPVLLAWHSLTTNSTTLASGDNGAQLLARKPERVGWEQNVPGRLQGQRSERYLTKFIFESGLPCAETGT